MCEFKPINRSTGGGIMIWAGIIHGIMVSPWRVPGGKNEC